MTDGIDDSLEGGGGVAREQSSGGQKADLGLSGDESLRGGSKTSLTTGGPNLDLVTREEWSAADVMLDASVGGKK